MPRLRKPKTYKVMMEVSLWEREELPDGWCSKKIARSVLSFPVARVGGLVKYIANPVEVEAKVIKRVMFPTTPGVYVLTLDDGSVIETDAGMTARMTPDVGDYVVTQSDGYVYLNPKDVFERKYRPKEE